jgi:hypothetical protein
MTEAEFIQRAATALRTAATPQEAARGVYRACVAYAKAEGMKPEIECALRSPLQSARRGGSGHWYVNFEAGPHDWAVAVSMVSGDKVWAEPHYGFDLYFYPKGDE